MTWTTDFSLDFSTMILGIHYLWRLNFNHCTCGLNIGLWKNDAVLGAQLWGDIVEGDVNHDAAL
jgi:hypothetical protein